MDGTLLDTETPARAAFARAITDVGFDYRAEVYDRCIGTSHAKTEEILTSAYGERYDHVALHNSWSQRFNEHTRVHPIEVKPGVVAVLERLSEYSIPLAIATSNRREVCNQHLLEAGLLGFFQHFVCADEAGRTKPAPDPYLLAVHKLNVAAEVNVIMPLVSVNALLVTLVITATPSPLSFKSKLWIVIITFRFQHEYEVPCTVP